MLFPDLKTSEFGYITFKVLSSSKQCGILMEARLNAVFGGRASVDVCDAAYKNSAR